MKSTLFGLVLVAILALSGCETQADRDAVAAAQKRYDEVASAMLTNSQWELDKVVAVGLWCVAGRQTVDDPDNVPLSMPDSVWNASDEDCPSFHTYKTFLKCHDDSPTRAANQKVCSALQKRVADKEMKGKGERIARITECEIRILRRITTEDFSSIQEFWRLKGNL